MLVTPEEQLADAVRWALASDGLLVDVRSHVREGERVLRCLPDAFEAVVLDARAVETDHRQMLAATSGISPEAPLILLVERETPDLARTFMGDGGFDYCAREAVGQPRFQSMVERAFDYHDWLRQKTVMLEGIERQRKTDEHLKAVGEVAKVLTSSMDLEANLVTIMEKAKEVVEAEASTLLLLDEGTNELVFKVAHGERSEAVRETRLKLGEGLAGWVALHRRPLLIPDVYQDSRFSPETDKRSGFRSRCLICVPLTLRDKLIGVVQALNKSGGRVFEQEDLEVLTQFASFGAIAIENAKSYQRIAEEKKALEVRVRELEVRIDSGEKSRQIKAITESDYFVQLRARAEAIRRKF